MDPVTFLVFNSLLTGILIFGFQKYWEYRYDEKKYQDQIKFQENHTKRVKTMTELYHKFLVVEAALSQIHHIGTFYSQTPEEGKKIRDDRFGTSETEPREGMKDMGRYFLENRIYLTQAMNDEIGGILGKTNQVFTYMFILFPGYRDTPVVSADLADDLFGFLGLEKRGQEVKYPDVFYDLLMLIVHQQREKLEDLYRSVTDIKPL